MKIKKNIAVINFFAVLILLLSVTFCSGPNKSEKENKNISAEISHGIKTNIDNISETTCTSCHKLDKSGKLVVSKVKLEGAKPPVKGGSVR